MIGTNINERDEMTIKPGIYEGVGFEEYLEWPCFHKSMVSAALRSTAHLHQYIKDEKTSSKEMDFGSLVDALLLDPDAFKEDFVERPEMGFDAKGNEKPWNNQLKYCKEWNQKTQESGKTAYSAQDIEKAETIIKNIREHKTAGEWLSGGKEQVALVWEDQETGILCKGRIDKLQPDRIVDLKITFNASMQYFRRTMGNFLYHVQAAMYSEGWSVLNSGQYLPFSFVVAEDSPPHCVSTFTPMPDSLAAGTTEFRRAIRAYKDYLEIGPTGYSQFEEGIELLPYKLIVNEEDMNV